MPRSAPKQLATNAYKARSQQPIVDANCCDYPVAGSICRAPKNHIVRCLDVRQLNAI
jgi:hypothetical protein